MDDPKRQHSTQTWDLWYIPEVHLTTLGRLRGLDSGQPLASAFCQSAVGPSAEHGGRN